MLTPLAWMGLTTASCTSQDEDVVVENHPVISRSISATLRFADDVSLSAESLQAFVFDEMGLKCIAPIQILEFNEDEKGTATLSMSIDSDYTPKLVSKRCRLVVLANWKPTNGDFIQLMSQTFRVGDQMPLLGCVEMLLPEKTTMAFDAPNVYLLRSVPKVTVRLSQELADMGITLGNVSFNKACNLIGYNLPNTGLRSTLTPEWAEQAAAIFRPNTSEVGQLQFPGPAAAERSILMPELKNDGSYQLELSFLYDGKPFTGAFSTSLPLTDLATGNPIDLIRSHHYIYTIKALKTDWTLSPDGYDLMDIIVDPWDEAEVPPVIFE